MLRAEELKSYKLIDWDFEDLNDWRNYVPCLFVTLSEKGEFYLKWILVVSIFWFEPEK